MSTKGKTTLIHLVSGTMRLQKFLAQAGVCSRRAAEELIRHGRVEVNGERAELGRSVDPVTDLVASTQSRFLFRSRGFLSSSISQPVA